MYELEVAVFSRHEARAGDRVHDRQREIRVRTKIPYAPTAEFLAELTKKIGAAPENAADGVEEIA